MSNATVLETPVIGQITEDQIHDAITTFRHYFSEDAALAGVTDDEIKARIQDHLKSGRELAFSPSFQAPKPTALKAAGIPECPAAIAAVVVDCVFLFVNLAGLHPPPAAQRAAVGPVARVVAADVNGWLRLTSAFVDAATPAEKAAAAFRIGQTAWSVGMGRAIIASIQDSMQWWDWVIAGVTAIAAVAALFLTGGAAFIAQLALDAAALAFTISDAAKIPGACAVA